MKIGKLLSSAYWNTDSRINVHIESDKEHLIYKDLFMTALGNIVSNAQKFTPLSGRIDIYLRDDVLEIRDTGVGISKSEIPHIFDRLYKVDKSRATK